MAYRRTRRSFGGRSRRRYRFAGSSRPARSSSRSRNSRAGGTVRIELVHSMTNPVSRPDLGKIGLVEKPKGRAKY